MGSMMKILPHPGGPSSNNPPRSDLRYNRLSSGVLGGRGTPPPAGPSPPLSRRRRRAAGRPPPHRVQCRCTLIVDGGSPASRPRRQPGLQPTEVLLIRGRRASPRGDRLRRNLDTWSDRVPRDHSPTPLRFPAHAGAPQPPDVSFLPFHLEKPASRRSGSADAMSSGTASTAA